jgi:hypothetical protein
MNSRAFAACTLSLFATASTASASNVSSADLAEHSIEYQSHDRSTYRFLDNQREFAADGVSTVTLYISSKHRVFSRVTFHHDGKSASQVSESLRPVGALVASHPNFDYNTGETRTIQWKFENDAFVATNAGNGDAIRTLVAITRTVDGLQCTVEAKEFRTPGSSNPIVGKDPKGRLFERLSFARSTDYCRITEGNRLEAQ